MVPDHFLDLFPAPFGLAVTRSNPDFAAERLKRQTPLPYGFHDRAGLDAPAETNLFELIYNLLLTGQ